MMDALTYQSFLKAESDARFALARLPSCRTIVDVVRTADIHLDAMARPMKHLVPQLYSMEREAKQRLRTLIDEQVIKIEDASSLDDARAMRGALIDDCAALRGHYPEEWRYADRESRLAVQKAIQPATRNRPKG